mmetsp:Transcript_47050/g.92879  ORF Transcript_47050/g.92879 Transcript_47050/m.92879 type:complete len:222 (-) Transcript_47050:308-973(-)
MGCGGIDVKEEGLVSVSLFELCCLRLLVVVLLVDEPHDLVPHDVGVVRLILAAVEDVPKLVSELTAVLVLCECVVVSDVECRVCVDDEGIPPRGDVVDAAVALKAVHVFAEMTSAVSNLLQQQRESAQFVVHAASFFISHPFPSLSEGRLEGRVPPVVSCVGQHAGVVAEESCQQLAAACTADGCRRVGFFKHSSLLAVSEELRGERHGLPVGRRGVVLVI